jgi:hypothetical protein
MVLYMNTEFSDSLLVTLRLYEECFCELHSLMKEVWTSDWLKAALTALLFAFLWNKTGNAVSKR